MLAVGRWIPIAQSLGLLASFIGVLAITGYLFLVPGLYGPGGYTTMSAQMAVMSAVLGLAVLFLRPESGLTSVLTGPTTGGMVARRLLPFAILSPFLFIALSHAAEVSGLSRTAFGGEIRLLVAIVMCTVPVLWTAGLVYRIDKQRAQAEAHI